MRVNNKRMRGIKMIQIFKKELRSYLLNPLGYVYLTIFFVIVSMLFSIENVAGEASDFGAVLGNLRIALMIFVPAITMNLLVEERRNKTEQLMFTVPVTIGDIVVGKFLAATAMLVITMLVTMIYPFMLSFLAQIYMPSLITAYIGFILLGMALIAVCMFLSSFIESPIISFLVGLGTIFLIWLGEILVGVSQVGISWFFGLPEKWLVTISRLFSELLDTFCLMKKYREFQGGLLNISTVCYYITIIVLFVFLTVRQIERRRIG